MTTTIRTALAVALAMALAACGADAPAVAPAALVPAADGATADGAAAAQDAQADATAGSAADAAAAALVGLEVPPYPDGLEEITGTCISPSTDPAQVCSHGIGVIGRASANPARSAMPLYIVANRSAGRDGATARWIVTDAIAHPPAEEGAWVQAGTCAVDGKDDARVVALVADQPDAERLRASWARRMDFDSGRFGEVDPATVDCINEGFGL